MVDIRKWRPGLASGLGLLALLIFGLTLSRGVTLNSLPLAANLAGWDDHPVTQQPLVWLATWWIRLLPARWIPLAANGFSAVLAAAVLAVLARSVQLLPQNRHLLGRQPGPAAGLNRILPPLTALFVGGLEFNFWQEAVAATGEMVDLLLFAVSIWCVLEYTRDRRVGWLHAALLLWGMGIIENVGMLLLLPFFAVGVFWLHCPERINWRFVARMAGLLVLGSTIFLVLPVANGFFGTNGWSFGHAGLTALKSFRHTCGAYCDFFWLGRLDIGLLLASYFMLPLLPLLILIRQESGFPYSRMGRLERLVFHALNGICLFFCLWVTLDPCFDSWVVVKRDTGIFLPLLALIYLNACAAGYLLQFWLLVTTSEPDPAAVPVPPLIDPARVPRWLLRLPRAFLCLLPLLMAAVLFQKNLPAIRLFNTQPLTRLVSLPLRSLPPAGGVLLTDDAYALWLIKLVLAERTDGPPCLPVNIYSLPEPEYRDQLETEAPAFADWLTEVRGQHLNNFDALQLLGHAIVTHGVYELTPGTGFYFELLYQRPVGALYAMKLRDAVHFEPPPLSAEEIAAGEHFWDQTWKTELAPLSHRRTAPPPWLAAFLKKYFFVERKPLAQTDYLGAHFSANLNNWGVILQRQGRLAAAGRRFQQAVDLNFDNPAAAVNLENNASLQAARPFSLAGMDSAVNQFGNVHELSQTIVDYGEFDDPIVCYLLGCILQEKGFPHQAIEQFERVEEFVPDVAAPKLALADLYAAEHEDGKVTATIEQLRALPSPMGMGETNDIHLSMLEANSWFAQTNSTRARSVLRSVLQKHPGDPHIPRLVLQTYLAFGDYTNALQLIETQLAGDPGNISLMNNQAAMYVQMKQPLRAIPILTRVLGMTNFPLARLDRAEAYLQTGNLPEAEADYQVLAKLGLNPSEVELGLARIAEQRHEPAAAVRHYQEFLAHTPEDSPLAQLIRGRIKALMPEPAGN